MGNSESKEGDYQVLVKTSDRKGAGTNANVHIALLNKDGNRSNEYNLDVRFHDDFEQGQQDTFPLNLKDFGEIVKIELWRDRRIGRSDWCVDWVIIRDNVRDDVYVFPINRWIKAGVRTRWSKYDCSIPQNDTEIIQRKNELEEKRLLYDFEQKYPNFPAQVKDLPKDEEFSSDYMKFVITTKLKVTMHTELIILTTKPFKTLKDMEDVYRYSYKRPSDIEGWDTDLKFGNMALNGCNPTSLRLCTEIPQHFGVTSEMVEPFLEEKSFEECLKAKRIFITDHEIMIGIPKIAASLALYYVNDDGHLLPIAIQLQREKAHDNPVFLPSDPKYTWLLAKIWFNHADATYHETCTHLCFTHFVLETIGVAVHRNLSPSHPLFRILIPHLRFVMAINKRGLGRLLTKGGAFDSLFSLGLDGAYILIAKAFKRWSFRKNAMFPDSLAERDVGDLSVLPKYYYREDGNLIWDATKTYVATIVNHYYTTNDDINSDFELQNFRTTLVKSIGDGGCGINDVPGTNDRVTTNEEIIDIFTTIIFIASGGHASINFGQYDQYGYIPNYSGWLTGSPPTTKDEVSEKDIMDVLPDKELTLNSMKLIKMLSLKNTASLAEYDTQYMFDPVSVGALTEFKLSLTKIAKTIDSRNHSRWTPYVRFHPNNIPNDVCI